MTYVMCNPWKKTFTLAPLALWLWFHPLHELFQHVKSPSWTHIIIVMGIKTTKSIRRLKLKWEKGMSISNKQKHKHNLCKKKIQQDFIAKKNENKTRL
jgi:hypothetical protein